MNAQRWEPLGDGFNEWVRWLYVDTSENILFATGAFSKAGDIPANQIARWDGTQWDSIPIVNQHTTPKIIRYHDDIYFGFNPLMRWNGSNLDTIATFHGGSGAFYIYQDELLILGSFDTINGIAASIAKYDGTTLSAFDTTRFGGWSTGVAGAIEYKGDLYIWGNFYNYNASIRDLARWDGAQWHPVGGNIFTGGITSLSDMEVYNGDLWIGGCFNEAWGNQFNGIARWNGTEWLDPGGGILTPTTAVRDIQVFQDELYIVGNFISIAGLPVTGIAKWNGEQWCGLGYNSTPSYWIPSALAVYNNELIIGGSFTVLDGDTMNYVAKWIGGNYTDTCTPEIIHPPAPPFHVEIWPNPADDVLTVQFNPLQPGVSTLEIYDVHGKLIQQKSIDAPGGTQIVTLDLSEIASGIYMFQIRTVGHVVRRKILKI